MSAIKTTIRKLVTASIDWVLLMHPHISWSNLTEWSQLNYEVDVIINFILHMKTWRQRDVICSFCKCINHISNRNSQDSQHCTLNHYVILPFSTWLVTFSLSALGPLGSKLSVQRIQLPFSSFLLDSWSKIFIFKKKLMRMVHIFSDLLCAHNANKLETNFPSFLSAVF